MLSSVGDIMLLGLLAPLFIIAVIAGAFHFLENGGFKASSVDRQLRDLFPNDGSGFMEREVNIDLERKYLKQQRDPRYADAVTQYRKDRQEIIDKLGPEETKSICNLFKGKKERVAIAILVIVTLLAYIITR